jgi:hypothetical protein
MKYCNITKQLSLLSSVTDSNGCLIHNTMKFSWNKSIVLDQWRLGCNYKRCTALPKIWGGYIFVHFWETVVVKLNTIPCLWTMMIFIYHTYRTRLL